LPKTETIDYFKVLIILFILYKEIPSGGINNVYTEFKKGGRVGFAEGGSMSKGLDYLSGSRATRVSRRKYID
jgi:hypothetical protein